MKIYALSGKSGTGKSYKAMELCEELGIKTIIDDGLLIRDNVLAAGKSAKKQSTKIGAVKTALFNDEEQRKAVAENLKNNPPDKLLLIGTSDRMTEIIAKRLELPPIDETIHIEDITTEEERARAHKQRYKYGKHVIPVPTPQLKKEFSGYFMHPLKLILRFGRGKSAGVSERSVVRPTYSYIGEYSISEKVLYDIVRLAEKETDSKVEILHVESVPVEDGVKIKAVVNVRKDVNMIESLSVLQEKAAARIEYMTAYNIERFDINVKGFSE